MRKFEKKSKNLYNFSNCPGKILSNEKYSEAILDSRILRKYSILEVWQEWESIRTILVQIHEECKRLYHVPSNNEVTPINIPIYFGLAKISENSFGAPSPGRLGYLEEVVHQKGCMLLPVPGCGL